MFGSPDTDHHSPYQRALELGADRRAVLLLRHPRLRCRLFWRRRLGRFQVHVEDAGWSEGAGRGFTAVPLFRREQGRPRQRPVRQRFRSGADQGGALLLRNQQSVGAVLPERLSQAERLSRRSFSPRTTGVTRLMQSGVTSDGNLHRCGVAELVQHRVMGIDYRFEMGEFLLGGGTVKAHYSIDLVKPRTHPFSRSEKST